MTTRKARVLCVDDDRPTTIVVNPNEWTPTLVYVDSVQERGNRAPRRRSFKPDLKARLVLEDLTGAKSSAEICREHRLKPEVLARWKVEFVERAHEIFATNSNGADKERIANLERMVGRLTMELEAARKA